MPIYNGNNRLSDIYSGNTSIGKVYVGNTLVFQKSGEDPPPPPPPEVRMDNAYGYLYNWYVIAQSTASVPRYINPQGWNIPTLTDFNNLKNYLDNTFPTDEIGKHMKSQRVVPASHPRWKYSSANPIENTTNFGAVPGGFRISHNGTFGFLEERSRIWANNSLSALNAAIVELIYTSDRFDTTTINGYPLSYNKGTGCSIILYQSLSLEEALAIPDFTILENWYTGNDGKQYNCVKIFNKIYTENLRETKYRGGSSITYGTSNLEWADGSSAKIPLRCAYNNDEFLATGNIN